MGGGGTSRPRSEANLGHNRPFRTKIITPVHMYYFAMLCAIGMVGGEDDQLAKRLTDAETRRIAADLLGQVQFQLHGQVHFDLVIEEMRPPAEQQVQEVRRGRIGQSS